MPYQTGDRVTVRNGKATWAGTVLACHERPDERRYLVRVTDFTTASVGEDMLTPAPQEKEAPE